MFHTIWVHLGQFCYCTKLGAERAELGQLMQKLVPWSHIGIFRNERSRSTKFDTKLMFWCISYRLGAFGIALLWKSTQCKMGWIGAINAKVCATKSLRNFSKPLHPIHPIGPLNSCFGAFHSARVHLGMFRYVSKLIAKRAEVVQLMQKFVPWSHIGIFRNKRTRSIPLDTKLMFWCVWDCVFTEVKSIQNGMNWCN